MKCGNREAKLYRLDCCIWSNERPGRKCNLIQLSLTTLLPTILSPFRHCKIHMHFTLFYSRTFLVVDYLVNSALNPRGDGIGGCRYGRTEMSRQGKDQYPIWSIDGPLIFSEVELLLSAFDAQLFSELYQFYFGKLVISAIFLLLYFLFLHLQLFRPLAHMILIIPQRKCYTCQVQTVLVNHRKMVYCDRNAKFTLT